LGKTVSRTDSGVAGEMDIGSSGRATDWALAVWRTLHEQLHATWQSLRASSWQANRSIQLPAKNRNTANTINILRMPLVYKIIAD